MRYVVMNMVGDIYNDEFKNKDDAIEWAEYKWKHLTKKEKQDDDLVVLECEYTDDDDGDLVWINGGRTVTL